MDENKIEFFNEDSSKKVQSNALGAEWSKIFSFGVFTFFLLIVLYVLFVNNGAGYFLILLMPLIFIFFPIYFIIISLRYYREKSNLHQLDKITFFILLFGLGAFFIYAMSTIF